MSILLKLRLKSLATLSKQMRRTEANGLSHLQMLRVESRLRDQGIPLRQMARIMKRAGKRMVRRINEDGIRVDGKLAIDGPPVPPEWITGAEIAQAHLHTLRTAYLRRELRAGYLAYAFLRDVPFDRVEIEAYEPVPLDRVEEIIGEYTAPDEHQIVRQRFAQWVSQVQIAIDEGRHPAPTKSEAAREWRRDREQAMRAGW